MTDKEIIVDGLQKLLRYIESEDYKGYDPYDALKSPLFKLPLLRSNKLLRFGAQQFVKRFPVNVRPLLGIPKGYNPVTLGLCIQGYAYLLKSTGYSSSSTALAEEEVFTSPPHPLSPSQDNYLRRIQHLLGELKKLIPPCYHGACWGYDFDWEARHAKIPAWQPTVVATGIITNALFIAYNITGIKECAELVESSAFFVLNDLNRTFEGDTFIFSYSPFDRQQVFNASMKGARLLSQAYYLTRNDRYIRGAEKAVKFVISKQQKDGSWDYSLAAGGGWKDNYHTGYILDCLHEFNLISGKPEFGENLDSGYKFYSGNFIEKTGMPRFFAGKKYPVDCTAAGQSILTLKRFNDNETAKKVAVWMISYMQDKNGSFYFRRYKNRVIKTSFMRWSNAWMFAALAYLISD